MNNLFISSLSRTYSFKKKKACHGLIRSAFYSALPLCILERYLFYVQWENHFSKPKCCSQCPNVYFVCFSYTQETRKAVTRLVTHFSSNKDEELIDKVFTSINNMKSLVGALQADMSFTGQTKVAGVTFWNYSKDQKIIQFGN